MKYNILIVDDEPEVAGELEDLLKSAGFSVMTANSGERGLEILEKVPARLIISDQRMDPGMSGTEFLTRVKERYPYAVTMILSAFSEKEYIMDALNKAGAYQYLLKPWDKTALIHGVTRALQFYHAESERHRLAEANARLLKKLSRLEMFSLAGNFSQTLYESFEPYLMGLMGAARSGTTDSNIATIIHKLGKLGMLQNLKSQECVSFRNVDIVPFLKKWVSEAKALEPGVEFAEEYEQDLPALQLNVEHFSIAVKALIENAVIFNDKKKSKKVTIRAKRARQGAEDFVRIEVEDNGPGVDESLGEKIYYPLETTHHQESKGAFADLGEYNFSRCHHVGLGLSIAQLLVTHHNGLLDFESEKGSGSVFIIRIPPAPEEIKR